jgi:hypothetical protein
VEELAPSEMKKETINNVRAIYSLNIFLHQPEEG